MLASGNPNTSCVSVFSNLGARVVTKKVIFVDDDPSTKTLASRTSDRLDCEFLFFERISDVFDCITWLKPRLVVLDLMMTNLEGDYDERAGIEISTEIRKQLGDQFPILILTGSDRPNLIAECLRGGADDYYVKSHDFTGLIKRIAAWLVVAYNETDAQHERVAAADVLDLLVAQKGLLTVREWRQVARLEVCRHEDQNTPVGERNSTLDLLAWRRTSMPT